MLCNLKPMMVHWHFERFRHFRTRFLSLHPGLNDSNGECGNFQECCLSNSNPQQPESALQSPLLLEMMVN